MRTVKYKTHWSYLGSGVKRQGLLAEFVLDVIYLMHRGIIPPFHILNQVLQGGGYNGGMGPGTSWRPFTITEAEYEELVEALLKLDAAEAKKQHPYIDSEKVIVDETLHQYTTFLEWLGAVTEKYPRTK
ncbi:MAG: hypothetical protein DPW16_08355 [Chloroflexi bacterium]|nr:hypothetical protein [Chloroflexota bacterium]